MFQPNRKHGIVLGVLVALIAAASAYAYFTSTGSGSTTGSVTAGNRSVALAGEIPAFTELGQTQTVTVTATNNGTSPVNAVIDTITVDEAGTGCEDGSFTISAPSSTPKELAPGASGAIATAVVTFHNKPSSQNGCAPKIEFSSK